jgi:hypothetical protein
MSTPPNGKPLRFTIEGTRQNSFDIHQDQKYTGAGMEVQGITAVAQTEMDVKRGNASE